MFKGMDKTAVVLVVLIGLMLVALSVLRYEGYNARMLDLGNMSQAIWSATQGHPLEYTHEDGTFSRLAWHAEVIYFLIAPLYALLPDPRTLLVLQAGLFALSAWPVYRIGLRHLKHRRLALLTTLAYLLYPTAQTAVLADFHGDTVGMPLLAFALDAMDRRAWRGYALWIGLALLSKVYVAAPVAVLGAVLWLRGRRRVGFATALAAVLWGSFLLLVVGPAFTPPDAYQAHSTPFTYFEFYFGGVGEHLIPTLVPRLLHGFVVLAPVAWLSVYAPLWTLPAFAVILPALLGVGDVITYDYRFHHYALAVPFLVYAVVRGAGALRERQGIEAFEARKGRSWWGDLLLTLGIILILNVGLINTPLNPRFWSRYPGYGLHPWSYGVTERDALKDAWLARHVPEDAALATSEFLAPHLVNRRTLYLVRYPYDLKSLGRVDSHGESVAALRDPDVAEQLFLHENLEEVDYVVADALFDYASYLDPEQQRIFYGVLYDLPGVALALRHPDFDLVEARDGLLLFARDAATHEALEQRVEVTNAGRMVEPEATFGDAVGLLDAGVEPLGGRRYRLSYTWFPLRSLDADPPLLAVSRLEGAEGARIVHLPTVALHPTVNWETGGAVHETFEVELPESVDPGTYRLFVGWYDTSQGAAYATDERSRVGQEIYVGTVTVE